MQMKKFFNIFLFNFFLFYYYKNIKFFNLIFMNFLNSENNLNNKSFILYEGTYQSIHNSNRLFNFIKNIDLILMLEKSIHHIPINIIGKDTFTVGNVFKGILFFSIPYVCKVLKYINSNKLKKIKWEITTKSIKNLIKIFHIIIKLYKVTDDNSTVIYLKIKALNSNIEDQTFFKQNFDSIFKDLIIKVENILSNSCKDLIQIESGIISASMEDIWYFLVNIKELKKIAPLIPFDNINFTELNIEQIYEIYFKKTILIKIQIQYIDKKIGWNKWVIVFKIFDDEHKISANELMIHLCKINSNECQVFLIQSFLEPVSQEIIKKISELKIYVINSIKDYLENYKGNNNNNNYNNNNEVHINK